MRLVLLGPPGVGKGTEAGLLSQRLNLDHISTGDMLRNEVKEKTPLGREAEDFMAKGRLVPDALIMAMVRKRLSEGDKPAYGRGFILDGIPRTIAQAEELEDILREMDRPLDFVIDLVAGEKVLISRLSGRRVCKKCQALYHIINMPSKREGVCDRCGEELYQRVDDQVETIRHRLKVYQKETSGLKDFYKKKGILLTINAEGEVEETFVKIKSFLLSKCDCSSF